ncbi:hypothetical protein B0H67DRAFT_487271, partial [Lasiosphaeris hirsuta]
VSICSKKRHPEGPESQDAVQTSESRDAFVVDLHTVESPIKTSHYYLTLGELGLDELAVEGVLTLYAVPRIVSPAESTRVIGLGQNRIYLYGKHWELPAKPQTERGMAVFLSCLRVAVQNIRQEAGDTSSQTLHDSVLHVLHVLTRFPPAVRAMHLLLQESILEVEKCAALVQACYQVVKEMMSASPVARFPTRHLEGSRLFFGTLLCKAKSLALNGEDGSVLPYISSMKCVHLTNSETMEPIAHPVDTRIGLMERGFFNALKAGIIQFTEAELNKSLSLSDLDGRTKRAVLLSGGLVSTNTMFDMNILSLSDRYDEDKIFGPGEISNIIQLAGNASMAKMQVVAPRSLGTAPNPVLTLDRDGFLAVYLRRKPCGGPGCDFVIFRPTKGGECDIDPAVIAQLLEPITAARIADGTAIFYGDFHATQRQSDKPDEILMICVDSSSSMSLPAGFEDVKPAEPSTQAPGTTDYRASDLTEDIFQNEIYVGTLSDEKEALQNHEAFDDMVQTVRACAGVEAQRVAVLELLKSTNELNLLELRHAMEQLESVEGRYYHWRDQAAPRLAASEHVKALRRMIAGHRRYENQLADFLVYRAVGISGPGGSNSWTWDRGSPLPDLSGSHRPEFASTPLKFEVPADLRCPMAQDLFQDPVTIVDGQIYDDAAIRRWFQVAQIQTSPLTGLPLDSTELGANRQKALQVGNWVEGTDIISGYAAQPRAGTPPAKLEFLSSRTLPSMTPLSELYEVAFRALHGHYPDFSLLSNGAVIQPSEEPLIQWVSHHRADSRLHICATRSRNRRRRAGSLIKVYQENPSSPSFSYWVKKDTQVRLDTVLFKAWRHGTELNMNSGSIINQSVIWPGLVYTGDGMTSGNFCKHWEQLSKLLKRGDATGVLGDEPVYSGGTDGSSDIEVGEATTPHGPQPLVLKLLIAPYKRRDRRRIQPSRIDMLKQMFDQFVNRILAYDYTTHLGLVTFGSTARVDQPLTSIVENFRLRVQHLKPKEDTALWDALALARDQLQAYSASYPDAKKRILCISDGSDSSSKIHHPHSLSHHLALDDIVVDSFCLGDLKETLNLRTVSYLTNGYKFHPTSLTQAVAICEMEPVLSYLERDVKAMPASRQPRELSCTMLYHGSRFAIASQSADPETVSESVFPKRIQHPGLHDSFVELQAVSRQRMREAGPSGHVTASQMRSHRILTEMQRIVANPHPHIDVYVSERDMSFWIAAMQGPPGSIYADGTFVVYLDMEETYPSLAPKARFVTRIYHPNVNKHGRICHSIMDRNWTVDTSNWMVISTIYGLLMQPDYSDPVNIITTLDFHADQVAFATMAREYVEKYAKKDRA